MVRDIDRPTLRTARKASCIRSNVVLASIVTDGVLPHSVRITGILVQKKGIGPIEKPMPYLRNMINEIYLSSDAARDTQRSGQR